MYKSRAQPVGTNHRVQRSSTRWPCDSSDSLSYFSPPRYITWLQDLFDSFQIFYSYFFVLLVFNYFYFFGKEEKEKFSLGSFCFVLFFLFGVVQNWKSFHLATLYRLVSLIWIFEYFRHSSLSDSIHFRLLWRWGGSVHFFFFFFFVLPKTKIFSVLRGSLRPAEFWMPKRQRGEATTSRSSSAGSSQIKRKENGYISPWHAGVGRTTLCNSQQSASPKKCAKEKRKRKRKMSV